MNEPAGERAGVMDKRANNFDFLRFVLAALVIYSHSFFLLLTGEAYNRREPFRWLTRNQAGGGDLAVDAFFVISGYLITQSWLRDPSPGVFLRKRAARIYPAFLAAAVFCWLLVGPIGGTSLLRYAFDTLRLWTIDIPGAFNYNPWPHGVNGSTWTIRFEACCYLGVMALGLAGGLKRPAVSLALFGAALIGYGLHDRHGLGVPALPEFIAGLPVPVGGRWPRLGCFFLAGICYHHLRDRLPADERVPWIAGGLIAATCLLGKGLWLTLPICGGYLLFRFAFSDRLALSRFGRYGDFSYGLYLYAFPIQQTLVQAFGPRLTPHRLFVAAFALTLLCAVTSWYLIERRFLRRRRAN